MANKKVIIAGAGLSGTLLGIYLADSGYEVEIYEKRLDMRKTDAGAGRSINLAISVRGLAALDKIGLQRTVLKGAMPMRGRMIHSEKGTTTFQPYGVAEQDCINSISRGFLNAVLMDEAEKRNNVKIHFDRALESLNLEKSKAVFKSADGKTETIDYQLLVGADGAGSMVRKALEDSGHTQTNNDILPYGYKELTIPPGPPGRRFSLEENALHIWPRKSYMLIALPNSDGSFTCTLFLPYHGPVSFDQLQTADRLQEFFLQHFPDAYPLLTDLNSHFFKNPTGLLGTVRSRPWSYKDKVLLLGDAAHAVVPFYGQGMNCAFESTQKLIELLQMDSNLERAFKEFENQRRPNTEAIADMALANFVEMRDLVGDPRFLLKKEVSLKLSREYPKEFVDQYSLVTFRTTPYFWAKQAGDLQERLLNDLCKDAQTIADIDWEKARNLVKDYHARFRERLH
ncbi:MAG: FAD-dependent oxidoreductase [Oligoflexales bacterium]